MTDDEIIEQAAKKVPTAITTQREILLREAIRLARLDTFETTRERCARWHDEQEAGHLRGAGKLKGQPEHRSAYLQLVGGAACHREYASAIRALQPEEGS